MPDRDIGSIVEACTRGNGEVHEIEAAVAAGANVNAAPNGALLPLMCAVKEKRVDIVNALLRLKADPNLPDSKGVRPLHAAIFDGVTDVVQALIDSKADVNRTDRHGQTPLFFAPSRKACSQLGQAKCDVNVLNDKGQSALHLAAHAGLNDTVLWLVECMTKETINAQDKHGRTAVYCAAHSNLKSTILLLQEHGADVQLRPHKYGVVKAKRAVDHEQRKQIIQEADQKAGQKVRERAGANLSVDTTSKETSSKDDIEIISPKRPLSELRHLQDETEDADPEVLDELAKQLDEKPVLMPDVVVGDFAQSTTEEKGWISGPPLTAVGPFIFPIRPFRDYYTANVTPHVPGFLEVHYKRHFPDARPRMERQVESAPAVQAEEDARLQTTAVEEVGLREEDKAEEAAGLQAAAVEEARLREEEDRKKAEEARVAEEEQARVNAEEKSRRDTTAEDARLKEEADRQKAEEAKLAEEARAKAEEDARLQAEAAEEARRREEEDRKKAKAAEEAAAKAAEEAAAKAAEEARLKEEEDRKKADDDAKLAEEKKAAAEAKARAMQQEEELKARDRARAAEELRLAQEAKAQAMAAEEEARLASARLASPQAEKARAAEEDKARVNANESSRPDTKAEEDVSLNNEADDDAKLAEEKKAAAEAKARAMQQDEELKAQDRARAAEELRLAQEAKAQAMAAEEEAALASARLASPQASPTKSELGRKEASAQKDQEASPTNSELGRKEESAQKDQEASPTTSELGRKEESAQKDQEAEKARAAEEDKARVNANESSRPDTKAKEDVSLNNEAYDARPTTTQSLAYDDAKLAEEKKAAEEAKARAMQHDEELKAQDRARASEELGLAQEAKVTEDDLTVTGTQTYPLCNGIYVKSKIRPCSNNAGRDIFKGPGAKYLFYCRKARKWIIGDDYKAHKAWLCSAVDESLYPTDVACWREWDASSKQFKPNESIKVQKVGKNPLPQELMIAREDDEGSENIERNTMEQLGIVEEEARRNQEEEEAVMRIQRVQRGKADRKRIEQKRNAAAVPTSDFDGATVWEVPLKKIDPSKQKYGFSHTNAKVDLLREYTKAFMKGATRVDDSQVALDTTLLADDEYQEALIVKKITEKSLMGDWNFIHPEAEVKPGDRIIEVNGFKKITEMQTQLRTSECTLKVLRLPETFYIVLDKNPERKFGFKFEKPAVKALHELRVTEIAKDGLMDQANRQNMKKGLHHKVVLPGMRIEAADEVEGDCFKIAEALRKCNEPVKLRIRRAGFFQIGQDKVLKTARVITAMQLNTGQRMQIPLDRN